MLNIIAQEAMKLEHVFTDATALHLYGASDDLIEVETEDKSFTEEYDYHDSGDRHFILIPDGDPSKGGVRLYVFYSTSGNWVVGASPLDEGLPYPDWNILIGQHPSVPYSSLLLVEVPAGAILYSSDAFHN